MENQVSCKGLDDLQGGPRYIKTSIFLGYLSKVPCSVSLFGYVGILLHFSFMV